MSVVHHVFFHRSKAPTAQQWSDAIRAAGFDMTLDPSCEFETHDGGWPCRYRELDAGFEFGSFSFADFRAALEEDEDEYRFTAEQLQMLGDRDWVIEFITHSGFDDLATAVIAAGVLADITGACFWYAGDAELMPASKALDWAREQEEQILPEIENEKERRERSLAQSDD